MMKKNGENTDAINGMETPRRNNNDVGSIWGKLREKVGDFVNPDYIYKEEEKTNGVRIVNVDELAINIAERINGAISIDVPDTQVQLLINGTGGNEWTITKY